MSAKVWLKGLSDRKNTMAFYRLDLRKSDGVFCIKVASSTVFRLMINGELLGYGPRRTYKGHYAINSYDISRYVNLGDCHIVIESVYYGNDSFYIISEQPFVWCEIFNSGKNFKDITDFKSYFVENKQQKVIRFSWQRHFIESFEYDFNPFDNYSGKVVYTPYPIEILNLDCRLDEVDLPYPTFNELKFKMIEEGGVERLERKIDYLFVKSSAQDEYSFSFNDDELQNDTVKDLSQYCFDVKSNCKDRFYTYELIGNKTGFIKTNIAVDGDCAVYYVFDELINETKNLHINKPKNEIVDFFNKVYKNGTLPIHFSRMSCNSVVKYSLKKGSYNLLTIEPYTLKYLRIIVVGATAQINDCSLVLYENPDIYNYKYTSDNERLVKIFNAAQSTLSQNSVDLLTDCPSRERSGWLCDSFFSARAEKLLSGNNRVERNLLLCYLHDSGREDIPKGVTLMCYPNDHKNGKFIVNWTTFLYLELEQYTKRTKDISIQNQFKDKAYEFYSYLERFENEYGLLENLEGWIFVEWSKCNEFVDGVNFPSNMLYYAFLNSLYRMYGDESKKIKAEKLKNEINKIAFNGTFYEDNAIRENGKLVLKNHVTETCQYYAFYFGITDKEENAALYKILFKDFCNKSLREKKYSYVYPSNMFIGHILRIDYLHRIGLKGQAISECVEIFSKMAEKTGTLWEGDDTMASCCHAFASICTCWLVDCK